MRWIDQHVEEMICFVLLVVMTCSVAVQVVCRFVGAPLAWTEELARYCFVWLIYISCAYAIKMRGQIKVDVLCLLFKRRGVFILSIFSNLLFLVFALVVAYICAKQTYTLAFLKPQVSAGLKAPMWLPNLGIPVGAALMVFRLVQDTVKRVREYRAPEGPASEKAEGVSG